MGLKKNLPTDSSKKMQDAIEAARHAKYILRLFVAGNSPKSSQAIETIHEICENKLQGRYSLEVIDIYQQPELAREAQVVAAPTLIKTLPQPLRRVIGNLSSKERILIGLDLHEIEDANHPKQEDEDKDRTGPGR